MDKMTGQKLQNAGITPEILERLYAIGWQHYAYEVDGIGQKERASLDSEFTPKGPNQYRWVYDLAMDVFYEGKVTLGDLLKLCTRSKKEGGGTKPYIMALRSPKRLIDKFKPEGIISRMTNVLAVLTEDQRKVIECYYRDGLSVRDTGVTIGYDLGRIEQLKTQALKQLRSSDTARIGLYDLVRCDVGSST